MTRTDRGVIDYFFNQGASFLSNLQHKRLLEWFQNKFTCMFPAEFIILPSNQELSTINKAFPCAQRAECSHYLRIHQVE